MTAIRTPKNIFPERKAENNGLIGYISVDEYFSKLREAVSRKYRERLDFQL